MPRRKINGILAGLAFCVGLPSFLLAQAPVVPLAKPDTEEVKAMVEKAKRVGGRMWADEVHFFCELSPDFVHVANGPDDPPITPTKIFDNVYAVGNTGTAVYVFQTSDGLLMIDSSGAKEVDSEILPGFQKLGLDPANVKIIVIGHGHPDHFGGAPYFQDHYGSKVYISAADWDMMENPPPGRGGKKKGPGVTRPKHDLVLKEGEPVVLGDLKIMPVAVPGHTPGAMGFIFQVKDNGTPHVVGLYGGTILTPGIISDEWLETSLKSVRHFEEETKKAKADTIMQEHPVLYPFVKMLDQLQARKKGQPNPFVVGQANYQKFLEVTEICTEVNIARRKH